jgi:mono/diheme cytochrome c family protein
MKDIIRILLILVLGSVVACEGTIDLGENTQWQGLPQDDTPVVDGKADNLKPVDDPGDQEHPGAALFQQHCGACHGADATGAASFPTTIRGYEPIDSIVKEGKGSMPAVAIDDAAIASIQDFLLQPVDEQQNQQEEEEEEEIDGSSPALEIFAAECAPCHGAEGEGNEIGPQLRFRDDDLFRFTVRNGRNGPGVPSAMPTYNRQDLPDEKLDEIVDWLSSFSNPETGQGLYGQYCANCHGDDALGGPSFEPIAGLARVDTEVRNGHSGPFQNRHEYMTAWTEDELSAEEVDLIEQYLMQM